MKSYVTNQKKIMQKQTLISQRQNRLLYFAFTISGLLMLLLAKDLGWAGVSLALAIVFDPNSHKHFSELTFMHKFQILGQMVVAIILIGINLFFVAIN